MRPPIRYNDPAAERLWQRCAKDKVVKELLEVVLSSDEQVPGRVLLLSPQELFGETVIRPPGSKLTFLFRLTELPYLSHSLKNLDSAFALAADSRHAEHAGADNAKQAIAEWAEVNRRGAQDLVVAALLETVRRNQPLLSLTAGADKVTALRVRQGIPDYGALDWQEIPALIQLAEPFLKAEKSRKAINRITLNCTALVQNVQPDIMQERLICWTAGHFVRLLNTRRVTQRAWRDLLFGLIDLGMVLPCTQMFLWCRRCPHGGFALSTTPSVGTLPPFCPSCGGRAHAVACYTPHGPLLDAMTLKDGLLGAAIGWHLKTSRITFWHALSVKGTEIDFAAKTSKGHLLIEAKMLHVLGSEKQIIRNLRDSLAQLTDHADLLRSEGWKLQEAICVVNLTERHLRSLQRVSPSIQPTANNLLSYERFPRWLRQKLLSARKTP
jgi:hypothetical protein